MNRMRFALALLCLLSATFAGAQGNASLFDSTRVDATILVHRNSSGIDEVQVSVLNPAYSMDLLQHQIDRLGAELNFPARGVRIYPYRYDPSDANGTVVKAVFGTQGLIEPETGVLHIQPIARAFALAEGKSQINGLMLQFQNQTPSHLTLAQAAPPAPGCAGVEVEGHVVGGAEGVEYRVKYLTHDPAGISVPDRPEEAKPAPVKVAPHSTDWTLISLITVAAAAVGALVYSLVLRSQPRGNHSRGGRPRVRA